MSEILPQGVVAADAGGFNKKLARLKEGGSKNLHIVADFDMTLTAGTSADPNIRNSSWGALQSTILHPKWFTVAYEKLFETYSPVASGEVLSSAEKDRLLHEWYAKTVELVMQRGLKKADIIESARSGIIEPRKGLKEFFEIARRGSVPIVVFSAGLGDFIEEYLKFLDAYSDNVHIVSNFYTFDSSGLVVGQASNTVHSLNKNETHADYDVHAIAKGRTDVLLLGDFEFDIHMADGERHNRILSMGFLNGKHEYIEKFKNIFDAVIVEDVGLDFPISILKEIESATVS
jgi:HAD superfamily hydrolase (TIGR01544 family)